MAQPTYEACESIVISVGSFAGYMAPGTILICPMTFQVDGKPFNIRVTVDTRATPFVELAHLERRTGGLPVRERVNLVSTPQPFGGRRWWFQCPVTGRMATKLFLPRGARHFASRSAWGLGYATQRAGRLEKISRRAARAYRSIGGKGNWREGLADKPKWMRWRTYSQRALALRAAMAEHSATWVAEVLRQHPHLRRVTDR
jgi:hypothetical protein